MAEKIPFANDGSFMEMWTKMQQAQQQAASVGEHKVGKHDSTYEALSPPPPPASNSAAAGEAEPHQAGDSEQQLDGGGSSSPQQPQAAAPTSDVDAAASGEAAAAAVGAALPAGPMPDPDARPGSTPSVVLKSKKTIVQVRSRSGDVLQGGSSKRKKVAAEGEGADGGGSGDAKSFYLKELERFRQVSCDSVGGSDRPLVK